MASTPENKRVVVVAVDDSHHAADAFQCKLFFLHISRDDICNLP
jgi:hypothetical protein